MPSEKNKIMLKDLSKILSQYNNFFITENKGMTVAEISTLRTKLVENKSLYKIVKNRLFKLSLSENKITDVDPFLKQSNGVLFVNDPIKDAKVLASFMKTVKDKIEIKAGYVDGQIVDAEYINTLSSLLSKEELVSKLLMILKNPVQKFVMTVNAISKQKEENEIY